MRLVRIVRVILLADIERTKGLKGLDCDCGCGDIGRVEKIFYFRGKKGKDAGHKK